MAKIGMKYPVYAPFSGTHTPGTSISYSTGAQLCHAISADVTINRRDNPLYGDDTKIENDKGITDYSITFTGDDLPATAWKDLLGETEKTTTSGEPATTVITHYEVNDNNPPYVGFGYYRVLMVDNIKYYEAFWFHQVQFAKADESATTKNEQIDWGTYQINGTGFGVELDSSGTVHMYDHMKFDTEANAIAWIKARAGIT